jgi:hypothetical protein
MTTDDRDTNPPSNIVPLPGLSGLMTSLASPASLRAATSWLTVWTPADPVPDGEPTKLPAYVAAAEEQIRPANQKEFAVSMLPLIEWVQRFEVVPLEPTEKEGGRPGKRQEQIAEIVRGYRQDLSDLPADLLAIAVKRTLEGYRYRKLPMPGDIRMRADEQLSERRFLLMRLKTAADIAKRSKPEPMVPRERTPQSAEMAARMVAAVNSIDAEPKKVPAEPDDLRPEKDSSPAAVNRRVQESLQGFRRIPKPWEQAPANPAPDGAA